MGKSSFSGTQSFAPCDAPPSGGWGSSLREAATGGGRPVVEGMSLRAPRDLPPKCPAELNSWRSYRFCGNWPRKPDTCPPCAGFLSWARRARYANDGPFYCDSCVSLSHGAPQAPFNNRGDKTEYYEKECAERISWGMAMGDGVRGPMPTTRGGRVAVGLPPGGGTKSMTGPQLKAALKSPFWSTVMAEKAGIERGRALNDLFDFSRALRRGEAAPPGTPLAHAFADLTLLVSSAFHGVKMVDHDDEARQLRCEPPAQRSSASAQRPRHLPSHPSALPTLAISLSLSLPPHLAATPSPQTHATACPHPRCAGSCVSTMARSGRPPTTTRRRIMSIRTCAPTNGATSTRRTTRLISGCSTRSRSPSRTSSTTRKSSAPTRPAWRACTTRARSQPTSAVRRASPRACTLLTPSPPLPSPFPCSIFLLVSSPLNWLTHRALTHNHPGFLPPDAAGARWAMAGATSTLCGQSGSGSTSTSTAPRARRRRRRLRRRRRGRRKRRRPRTGTTTTATTRRRRRRRSSIKSAPPWTCSHRCSQASRRCATHHGTETPPPAPLARTHCLPSLPMQLHHARADAMTQRAVRKIFILVMMEVWCKWKRAPPPKPVALADRVGDFVPSGSAKRAAAAPAPAAHGGRKSARRE